MGTDQIAIRDLLASPDVYLTMQARYDPIASAGPRALQILRVLRERYDLPVDTLRQDIASYRKPVLTFKNFLPPLKAVQDDKQNFPGEARRAASRAVREMRRMEEAFDTDKPTLTDIATFARTLSVVIERGNVRQSRVRTLHYGSPFHLDMVIYGGLGVSVFSSLLYGAKRVLLFPAEVRTRKAELKADEALALRIVRSAERIPSNPEPGDIRITSRIDTSKLDRLAETTGAFPWLIERLTISDEPIDGEPPDDDDRDFVRVPLW